MFAEINKTMKEYFSTKVGDLDVSIFITSGDVSTSRDVPDDDDEVELDGIYHDGVDVEYLCTGQNIRKLWDKYAVDENLMSIAEITVMDLGMDSDAILGSAYDNYKSGNL